MALGGVTRGETAGALRRYPRVMLYADLLVRNQVDRHFRVGPAPAANGCTAIVSGEFWSGVKPGSASASASPFCRRESRGIAATVIRDDVFERRLEVPQLKKNLADFHEGTAVAVLFAAAGSRRSRWEKARRVGARRPGTTSG